MSEEIFQIVLKMDINNRETQMAMQCAPLLAGLKISNLFIVQSCDEFWVESILENTDISFFKLLQHHGKTTYLLFRKNQLEVYLGQKAVIENLRKEGYSRFFLEDILKIFKGRYLEYMEGVRSFPHEMGFLFGYPVEDVEGFIANEGNHCLHSGHWKVYSKVREKKFLFQQFEYAKEALIQHLAQGMSMREILSLYCPINMQQAAM